MKTNSIYASRAFQQKFVLPEPTAVACVLIRMEKKEINICQNKSKEPVLMIITLVSLSILKTYPIENICKNE